MGRPKTMGPCNGPPARDFVSSLSCCSNKLTNRTGCGARATHQNEKAPWRGPLRGFHCNSVRRHRDLAASVHKGSRDQPLTVRFAFLGSFKIFEFRMTTSHQNRFPQRPAASGGCCVGVGPPTRSRENGKSSVRSIAVISKKRCAVSMITKNLCAVWVALRPMRKKNNQMLAC
jgi:hypothetical protein